VPLKAQPGTGWGYSLSLEAAARLVEVVSGVPYATFLQMRLFEPLGMVDTTFRVTDEQLPRFSALYDRPARPGDPPVLLEAPQHSPDYRQSPVWTPGSFGLVSTVPDFAQFLTMQANGGMYGGKRILGSHTVSLLMANHLPPDLLPYHFDDSAPLRGYGHGLGVHVLMDRGLAGVPYANGEVWKDGGCGTLGWIDPANEVVGVLMFQLTGHWVHHIFSRFRALVYQALDA
jgi:CubicO group peptidase (beta-lactamase class C family)